MNFELSEEQLLIRGMVKEFAASEVAPIAAEIDRDHRFPEESIPKLAKLNLLGVPYPEEFGGGGADAVSYVTRLSHFHGVRNSGLLNQKTKREI